MPGSRASALSWVRAYRISETPRMQTTVMVAGNSRLRRCPPRAPRPPARAARATFLAEDALPMARRGYRPTPAGHQHPEWRRARSGVTELVEQRLVAVGDVGGGRPGLDEAAAGRSQRLAAV